MENCFSKLQKESKELEEFISQKLKKKDSIYVLLTYLLAECGEIADKVRGLERNRVNSEHIKKEDLAKEIVDCVYNLMLIANYYGISLDGFWKKRLKEIKLKFLD